MANLRVRPETSTLFFDFYLNGRRIREYTALPDTPANRRKAEALLRKIEAAIALGTFNYAEFFPNSRRVMGPLEPAGQAQPPLSAHLSASGNQPAPASESIRTRPTVTFAVFAQTWINEQQIQWRETTKELNVGTLHKHLIPRFGHKQVNQITRADVLAFRAELTALPGRKSKPSLSPKTINHIVGLLGAILTEASGRFEFVSPTAAVKRLKLKREDIEPFSIEEVRTLIANVRPDYRHYFTVKFFTGMRTGELHGLKWSRVDFERRQILVRESLVRNKLTYTKTDGSQRSIEMSSLVEQALREQHKATGQFDFVFCNPSGAPLCPQNVVNRIWYPLLRLLKLKARRPYQCRHTAATLWLAAGENPEWIARQLGHTNTQMLFRVYSRYVPNLTRRDGSAMDRLLETQFEINAGKSGDRHA